MNDILGCQKKPPGMTGVSGRRRRCEEVAVAVSKKDEAPLVIMVQKILPSFNPKNHGSDKCARDCSGYRPEPKAMKAYERKARPGAQINSKQLAVGS
jgi:hypothetical protein